MSKLILISLHCFVVKNGWNRILSMESFKRFMSVVNRLQSEKERAAATAQAEAESHARSEVSRILSAERALAQENLQEAIVRERLTTEDARRRTELFVSPESCALVSAVSLYGKASLFHRMVPTEGSPSLSVPVARRDGCAQGARVHPDEHQFIHSPSCFAVNAGLKFTVVLFGPHGSI